MKIIKLSIIIPVFDEEASVSLILNKIKEVHLINNIKKEFVIINDNSQDHSRKIIQAFKEENPTLEILFINNETNQGKAGIN